MNETERSDGSTARSAAPSIPSLTLLKGPLPRSLFGSNASILGAHGGAVQIEAYGAMNETERSDGSTARNAAPSSPSLTLLKGLLPRSLSGSNASILGAHGGAVQIEAYGAMNETERSGGSTARNAAPSSPSLTLLKGLLPHSLFGSNASYRRPLDRRSKPQRWGCAVETLLTVQADYREWFDNLPENLLVTSLGEKLQAKLDLEPLQDIDPPRGYGRD